MIEAKDRIRTDKSALLAALREAGADIRREGAIKCPFHDDTSPSGGVYEDEGVWRFKCHAACCGFCGDVFDVRAQATGKSVEDQLRELREDEAPKRRSVPSWPSVEAWERSREHVARVYRYTNPDTGAIDLLKMRIEPPGERKTFVQARVGGDGRVYGEAPAYPHPLYNRTRVRDADAVVVVEGEKCVEALHAAGVVATCCPGGGSAGKASLADWKPLAGKVVYLWPDHDPVDANGMRGGHQHMREVAEVISRLEPRPAVWWLDPEKLGLGDKQDAADFVAKHPEGAADAVSDALDQAVPLNGSTELRSFIEDIIAGRWANVVFPSMPQLSRLAKPLMPGCICFVVGDPGSTKSMLAMQWGRDLLLDPENPVKVAIYMLEDDRRFHLLRALAQLSSESRVTDDEWGRKNPDKLRDAEASYREAISDLSRVMYDAPNRELKPKELLEWLERVCEGGARVVIIDPITAMDGGKEPWNAERDFMARAKAILRKYGASLILITHPRNANTRRTVDDLAGSRALGRFAQCVLWMRNHGDGINVEVRPPRRPGEVIDPVETCRVDREIEITKARNGVGQGARVGIQFDGRSLTFKSRGVIVRELKEDDE